MLFTFSVHILDPLRFPYQFENFLSTWFEKKNCSPYKQQDCSCQGEALNVPTAFYDLWSNTANITWLI